ncbi:hypothetical protein GCM10010317_083400 [Streptomyces mirabilis]|nr:hypothetical protein GCM10010317_083400 [Streptomyces mirabilis]
MPIPTDPGLTLTALSAEPGTAAHDSLRLLASWAATLDQDDQPETVVSADNEHLT